MSVDLEVRLSRGRMRAAILDLFENCDTPSEVEEVFLALLADIAVGRGWWQDADGKWFMPYVWAGGS